MYKRLVAQCTCTSLQIKKNIYKQKLTECTVLYKNINEKGNMDSKEVLRMAMNETD